MKKQFIYKISSAFLIVMLAVMALPARPVYAATTGEVVPTANGFYTAWTNGFAEVDETIAAASCAGGDYIFSNTNNQRETVVISLATIPNGSTITSIDVLTADRGDSAAGGTYRTFVRFNGTDSADSAAAHAVTGTGGPVQVSRLTHLMSQIPLKALVLRSRLV